jgi:hypothetical protein
MKKGAVAAGACLLIYLLFREVAWRTDFMAALAGVQRGRPLLALVEVLFFGLRVILVVVGPSLLAVLAGRAVLQRLTRS